MSESVPFVSIIMPIRNEGDFIAQSLGAVLAQDYPHERMEVIVADGDSQDNTRQIVQQLADAADILVTLIDNPGRIVPIGFNAAFRKSQGEIIVRVDGHTIIASDYVRQCVSLLMRSEADNVGGKMVAKSATDLGTAIAAATSTSFGVGGSRFHYSDQEEYVDTVYLGAWKRGVFDRIGLFDEELTRNQDDEFNYRLRASGGRILLSPAIKSVYFNRSSLRTLWRQYYQYGLYKVRVMQKHPRQMRPRQFVPVLLVSGIVGGALLTPFLDWWRRLWMVGVALYGTANLAAAVMTARKTGWRYLPRLPIIFATLHFSYGLGFLRGLVKFWKRWL